MHLWKLCFHICVFDRVTSGLNIRKKRECEVFCFCSLFLLNLLSDVH